jgi:hypothetical protein
MMVFPLGPVLGIPRCCVENFKIFDFTHRGPCRNIVNGIFYRFSFGRLPYVRLCVASHRRQFTGYDRTGFRLQHSLASRLHPTYFNGSLAQALLVNAFQEVLSLVIFMPPRV